MADIVNYGIIGCGMMGHEHMRNIALLPDARVAAIFEPDAVMADTAKSIAPDIVICPDLDSLLQRPDLDCLLIASPNFRHLEQLEHIAAQNPLPILVEKPLFTDPDQVDRLQTLRATYPAPIWVAMEYRYMPPIAALLNKAAEVTGGVQMLTIREHRFPFLEKIGDWNRFNRYTGGTFVEKCCHFFDLMRLVIGAEPVRVMASGGQAANHLDETYQGEVPDILDHGYVLVDFANGARAMLELCMFAEGARYQEEVSALGQLGKIEALVPGPGRFWPADLGDPPVAQLVISPRDPKGPQSLSIPVDPDLLEAGDHNGSTFYQHQKFIDVVRGTTMPEVSLADGWAAVAMGLAAQESMRTGLPVPLDLKWV
jgi:myo-inositol 2-dehydrogenase/D-chiro-inositol 1-dehydrogenase